MYKENLIEFAGGTLRDYFKPVAGRPRMAVAYRWYRCGQLFWIKISDRQGGKKAKSRICETWSGPWECGRICNAYADWCYIEKETGKRKRRWDCGFCHGNCHHR